MRSSVTSSKQRVSTACPVANLSSACVLMKRSGISIDYQRTASGLKLERSTGAMG
jgi:hypothetical protein